MPIVGIDLGTTFSSLAVLGKDGEPDIVPDDDGARITPSVVFFGPPDSADSDVLLVGVEARKQLRRPDREKYVIEVIKRKMEEAPSEDLSIGDRSFTPVELSALILEKLIRNAEEIHGEINEAVISVPASFKEPAHEATRMAGEQAGLTRVQLVDEPVAAALFFAATQKVRGRVLVYDLGGGTFDVAIADIDGKEVKVLASDGEPQLGGKDFDRALCSILGDKHGAEFDDWLYEENMPGGRLMQDAEELKKSLSTQREVEWVVEGKGQSIKITREEFEKVIIDGGERGECEKRLSDANEKIDEVQGKIGSSDGDIDFVLLVGGSTRIPCVRRLLEKRFDPDSICVAVNPDEAVARGAAIYAGWRNPERLTPFQEGTIREFTVTDVIGHDFGVVALEDPAKDVSSKFQELVAPNSMARKIAEELMEGYPCGLREPYAEFRRLVGPDSMARFIADDVIDELPGKGKLRRRKNLWVQRASQCPEIVQYTEYIGGWEGKALALNLMRDYVLKAKTLRDTKVLVSGLAEDRYQEHFTECRESWVERAEQIPEIVEFAEYISGPGRMWDDALELIGDVVVGKILLREGKYEAAKMVHEWFSEAIEEGREIGEKINSVILRGTRRIPCKKTRKYYTSVHGQTSLPIEVTQSTGGVRDLTSPNLKVIGRGVLADLPDDRPAGFPIAVTFDFDQDKILTCTYKDVDTGRSRVIELPL